MKMRVGLTVVVKVKGEGCELLYDIAMVATLNPTLIPNP